MLRINHKNYGIILAEPVRNYIHNDIEFMTVLLQTKIVNTVCLIAKQKNKVTAIGHNVGTEYDIAVCNIIDMVEVQND